MKTSRGRKEIIPWQQAALIHPLRACSAGISTAGILPRARAAPLAPLRSYPAHPQNSTVGPFLRDLLSYPFPRHLPLEHRRYWPRTRQISRCAAYRSGDLRHWDNEQTTLISGVGVMFLLLLSIRRHAGRKSVVAAAASEAAKKLLGRNDRSQRRRCPCGCPALSLTVQPCGTAWSFTRKPGTLSLRERLTQHSIELSREEQIRLVRNTVPLNLFQRNVRGFCHS